MKSKVTFIIFFFLVSLTGNAFILHDESNYSLGENSVPHGNDEIDLYGHLDLTHEPGEIEAYTDQNTVYVVFNRSFGYVNITLYNESGLSIYTDVVNTSVQQTVIIPITGAPNGTYTLVLENTTGYAEGEFNKEP